MMNKRCTACFTEKPSNSAHFYPHKGCLGGLDTACRSCRNRQRNDWKIKNRDRVNASRRAKYAQDNGEKFRELEIARALRSPAKITAERLIQGLRERSRKGGLELSPELRSKAFVERWLNRQPNCECCGVAFKLGRKNGQRDDASASFDRFHLGEGYTLQNTALICWRCNNIKRNYSAEDLVNVAQWMSRRGDEAIKFME